MRTLKELWAIVRIDWPLLAILAMGITALWATLPAPTLEAQGPGTGPRWEGSLDDIGATLTRIVSAPTSGEARYITDIVAQSTTATTGLLLLRTGTGTNCGTSTASLFPSASTVPRIGYTANTLAPTVISFRTPLRVAPNLDLCVIGTAVNTLTVQVEGYVAP